MKILCVGDVVGRPGREVLKKYLSTEKKEHGIDIVIANVENAAGGAGITDTIAEELFEAGVDVMTSGNHAWDKKKEGEAAFKKYFYLIRPANYPDCPEEPTPGKGSVIYKKGDFKIGVINVQGRLFLESIDCPFRAADKLVEELSKETNIIIVDMHAETTSEKQALAWYLDGRVSLVFGTHTHVQTADERILTKGTGYISDLGMTGPYDSVIGVIKERAIKRFLIKRKVPFETAENDAKMCGIIVDIDNKTGRTQSIQRIQWQKEQQKTN